MDVFISWSGEQSRAVAEALRNWLPKIINAIKPWLSSEDIDKGARWGTDVAVRLESAKAGIICLTPSNVHSEWILFEAGALSKTLRNTFVCPLLIGLDPSDIKPPLAQFQATRATKDDVLKLLRTLNSALEENALPDLHINEAFEVWWPRLDSQLTSLPPNESRANPHRSDRELLEEVLALIRSVSRPPDRMLASPDKGIALQVLSKSEEKELAYTEVMRVLGATVGRFSMGIQDAGTRAIYTVHPADGHSFDVELKKDVPLEEILPLLIPQIPHRFLTGDPRPGAE